MSEEKKIKLNKADYECFIRLPRKYFWLVLLWCFFNPKRVYRFFHGIRQGMSIEYALKQCKIKPQTP